MRAMLEPEEADPATSPGKKISRHRSFCRNYYVRAPACPPCGLRIQRQVVLKGGMLVAAIVGLDNRVILNAHFDTLITFEH